MSDPHGDDYCVICGATPTPDSDTMHPIASIEHGVICDGHVTERTDSASFGGYQ